MAEFIEKNPAAAIKVPQVGERTRTLHRSERVLVRRRAGSHLRRALLALEESACRPQEMRILEWDHIQPKTGPGQIAGNLADGKHWFELQDYKAKDRRSDRREARVIGITPRLGRLLDRLRRDNPDARGVIFPAPCGRAWTPNAFRCAFRRLRIQLDRAGLLDVRGLVPYTYRHTRATALARQLKNPLLLQRWMGHAKIETTAKYCHFSIEDVVAIGRRRWK